MSASQRAKGANGEREVVRLLKSVGFPAQRTAALQAGIYGAGADVVGIPGFHLEIKRAENVRIREWRRQAARDAAPGQVPVVVYRSNREPWSADLDLLDLLAVILEAKGTHP